MVQTWSTSANWALHLATAAATAAGLWYAYQLGLSSVRKHKKVYVLAVHITFKTVEDREAWVSHWLPMVEQAKKNEPGTLSYELCIADNDPCKVLVFERYVDKAALEVAHRGSPAMAKFLEATAPIKCQIQMHTYEETNIGFM